LPEKSGGKSKWQEARKKIVGKGRARQNKRSKCASKFSSHSKNFFRGEGGGGANADSFLFKKSPSETHKTKNSRQLARIEKGREKGNTFKWGANPESNQKKGGGQPSCSMTDIPIGVVSKRTLRRPRTGPRGSARASRRRPGGRREEGEEAGKGKDLPYQSGRISKHRRQQEGSTLPPFSAKDRGHDTAENKYSAREGGQKKQFSRWNAHQSRGGPPSLGEGNWGKRENPKLNARKKRSQGAQRESVERDTVTRL